MIQFIRNTKLKGNISIPSSKSDGQRALLSAALSPGIAIINNLGLSDDERVMLLNIQILGAKVKWISTNKLKIMGIEKFPEYLELDVGESGLGLRLLSGVCAVQKGIHSINGKGTLLERDQSFFERNLNKYGAEISSNNGMLPLVFKGSINTDEIEVDGSESSQYISGLLIGLALCFRSKKLRVNLLNSTPYVDMTLDTMNHFGVYVENDNYTTFTLNGDDKLSACKYNVESDWSSASYWFAAAAIGASITISGLNFKSKQADIRFLEALKLAGCTVDYTVDSFSITSNQLSGFYFDATDCPDLFPALVVLASKCNGTTKILGVERLVNKESNRGLALQQEFGKLGVNIQLNDGVMTIEGNSILKSARVNSNDDHRIAMSLGIIGTTISGGIEIENAEAVTKSYPEFWEHLAHLSAG